MLAVALLITTPAYVPAGASLSPVTGRFASPVVMGTTSTAKKPNKVPAASKSRTWSFLGQQPKPEPEPEPEKDTALWAKLQLPNIPKPGRLAAGPSGVEQGGVAAEAAAPKAGLFSLSSVEVPSLGLPSLDLLGTAAPIDALTESAEPEVEAAAIPKEESFLQQMGTLLTSVVATPTQLALSKIEIFLLTQRDRFQAKSGALIAEIKAVPIKAFEAAKKAVYMAPFYAQAAVSIAIEDAIDATDQFVAETQQRIEGAPDWAKAELIAAAEKARAAAEDLIAAAKVRAH